MAQKSILNHFGLRMGVKWQFEVNPGFKEFLNLKPAELMK